MSKADKPLNIVLKTTASGAPPARKPMPAERETANPAPDKDYTRKRAPFSDDEENDPEIEGE